MVNVFVTELFRPSTCGECWRCARVTSDHSFVGANPADVPDVLVASPNVSLTGRAQPVADVCSELNLNPVDGTPVQRETGSVERAAIAATPIQSRRVRSHFRPLAPAIVTAHDTAESCEGFVDCGEIA